ATFSLGRSFALDPQARFVYVGDGTLSGFIESWLLDPVESLPTTANSLGRIQLGQNTFPFGLAVESTGQYLYAVVGGHPRVYSIDQTTGVPAEVAGSPQSLSLAAKLVAIRKARIST